MEPPFYFVRDKASHAAHHWDYLRNRRATALCGHDYGDIQWEGTARPAKVCRQCQEVLPRFEATWWRTAARRAQVHRDRLEKENARLGKELTGLRRQMNQLTYQLELSKETIESQKSTIGSQKSTIDSQAEKIDNQRKTLKHLQTARAEKKKPHTSGTKTGVKSPSRGKAQGGTSTRVGVWRSADQVFSSGAKRSGAPKLAK